MVWIRTGTWTPVRLITSLGSWRSGSSVTCKTAAIRCMRPMDQVWR
jgi:hypothetical protein